MMHYYATFGAFVVITAAASGCTLTTTGKSDKTDKPADTTTPGGGSSSSTNGAAAGSDGGGGTSGDAATATNDSGNPTNGAMVLTIGNPIKVKLNTSVPKLSVPGRENDTPPNHGALLRVNLRSDQEGIVAACPDKGTDVYPYLEVVSADGSATDRHEGGVAGGGFEAYGQIVKHRPQTTKDYDVFVYNSESNMRDTGGDMTVFFTLDAAFKCPGP